MTKNVLQTLGCLAVAVFFLSMGWYTHQLSSVAVGCGWFILTGLHLSDVIVDWYV